MLAEFLKSQDFIATFPKNLTRIFLFVRTNSKKTVCYDGPCSPYLGTQGAQRNANLTGFQTSKDQLLAIKMACSTLFFCSIRISQLFDYYTNMSYGKIWYAENLFNVIQYILESEFLLFLIASCNTLAVHDFLVLMYKTIHRKVRTFEHVLTSYDLVLWQFLTLNFISNSFLLMPKVQTMTLICQ
mgnify:CR=1 FL=1